MKSALHHAIADANLQTPGFSQFHLDRGRESNCTRHRYRQRAARSHHLQVSIAHGNLKLVASIAQSQSCSHCVGQIDRLNTTEHHAIEGRRNKAAGLKDEMGPRRNLIIGFAWQRRASIDSTRDVALRLIIEVSST